MTLPLTVLAVLGAGAIAAVLMAWRPKYALLWVVLAAAGALAAHAIYLDHTADDAFISYRYARNWARGLGPVWNAGERVDGYTNFLWTAMLAVAAKAGLPLPDVGRWMGYVSGIGALVVTALIARQWPEPKAEGTLRWLPLVVVVLFAANGAFAAWTFAGLETPFFTALVALAAYFHIFEDRDPGRFPWSGPVLAAAALTRPEGLMFFAIGGAFKALRWWTAGRQSGHLLMLAWWVGLFATPYVIYFAWHYSYYGHPWPNSYYAKVGSGWDQYERGLHYVANFGERYAGLLVAFLPVAVLAWTHRQRETLYMLTALLCWTGYVVYIGGDTLVMFRMMVPATPFFYVLSGAGLVWMFDLLRRRVDTALVVVATALVVIVMTTSSLRVASTQGGFLQERVGADERIRAGRWLKNNVPADWTVALTAAGAIPYESELRAVDMLGLNDRHIAHLDNVDLGSGPAGHEKYDSAYVVVERQPELILLVHPWSRRTWCSPLDYQLARSDFIPEIVDLVEFPATFFDYKAYSVEVADERYLNVLLRMDIPEIPGAPNACTQQAAG